MATTPTSNAIDPSNVRCPTCRASQPWSDACRRCKSDLRLLKVFAGGYEQARRECLMGLLDGRPQDAHRAARRCLEISPDPEARRLLALASLQVGDWATAADLGRMLDGD